MLIEEWDNGSYLTCKLMMKEDSQPFNFATSAKIYSMGQLDLDKNLIRFSIPKRNTPERDFQIFLNATSSVESKDYWIMEFNKESQVKPLIEAMNIPSVYFNSIKLIGNEFHIQFSFHEMMLSKVSDFILKIVSNESGISIIDFGKKVDIYKTLHAINSQKPIYVLSMVSKPPERVLKAGDTSVKTNWIRLIKSIVGGKVNAIFRITEGMIGSNQDFIPVCESEKIYEGITQNEIIKEIESESRKNGLDYLLRMNKYDAKYWFAEYYISKEDVNALISIVSDVIERNEDWNLIIRGLTPFPVQ